jgi:hypothetical protein
MANSFDIKNCINRGCNKVLENICCVAYKDPSIMSWHRHGELCPLGPQQITASVAKKINPLKASKRGNK